MPKVESVMLTHLKRDKAHWPWGFIVAVAALWLIALANILTFIR